MRKTRQAFQWIVEILNRLAVPYQVTGGLAAKFYGSSRPLADIDIDIPENKFVEVIAEVKDRIIFGPGRYIDDNWDLMLITLKYGDQDIDLGSDRAKIKNYQTRKWQYRYEDFSRSEIHKIYGIKVPVISKKELVEYKKILNRPVDIEDIKYLLEVI